MLSVAFAVNIILLLQWLLHDTCIHMLPGFAVQMFELLRRRPLVILCYVAVDAPYI